MIKILFRVLTISLLYTSVCCYFFSLGRTNKEKNNALCSKRKDITICFPKKNTKSLCNQEVSFPEEQYQDCLRSSEICDAPGTFPIPRIPSRYYTCDFNTEKGKLIKKVKVCEKGTYFDPRTLKCLTPEEMIVSKAIPTKNIDFPPSCKNVEAVPNVHDCKSFYMCSGRGSTPVKLYCAPRRYFSEKLGRCTNVMTKSCLEKLHDSESINRDRARQHLRAMIEIIEKEYGGNFEDERMSGPPPTADFSDKDLAEPEAADYDEDEPDRPEPELGHPLSEESDTDSELGFLPSIRYIIELAFGEKQDSRNPLSDTNEEASKLYEELREQQEENEKMLEEMENDDEDTRGLEQIIVLNNHLMKSIAEGLIQNYNFSALDEDAAHSEYECENSKQSEGRKHWLKLARDQVSLSKYLRHLRQIMREY